MKDRRWLSRPEVWLGCLGISLPSNTLLCGFAPGCLTAQHGYSISNPLALIPSWRKEKRQQKDKVPFYELHFQKLYKPYLLIPTGHNLVTWPYSAVTEGERCLYYAQLWYQLKPGISITTEKNGVVESMDTVHQQSMPHHGSIIGLRRTQPPWHYGCLIPVQNQGATNVARWGMDVG